MAKSIYYKIVVTHLAKKIWMYNCTTVQLYDCTTVGPYNCMTVQSYDRTIVRPYNHTTVRLYDRTTIQGATFSTCSQLNHRHYLIISPLHGHGEVANENPLILPHTLSIVGALVLLKRCAGKKKCKLRFLACLNLYICTCKCVLQIINMRTWC